jgi:outer membrane lipoprotein-sorting protein
MKQELTAAVLILALVCLMPFVGSAQEQNVQSSNIQEENSEETASFSITGAQNEETENVRAIVEEMFNYMRGKASYSVVDMTIHRADWQRVMTIEAWTKGLSESIFVIIAPPKDNGNGTLKKSREMWIYNPKVNRIIKLPPSMMSQAWMGSDFSNNDLAKSDSLITDYEHTLERTDTQDGKKVYFVKSIPKPGAPVVWGMQRLQIREDGVLLREEFYDEDLKLVKYMTTSDIRMVSDRLYPMVWRMQKVDAEGEYTQLDYKKLEFRDDIPDNLFTLSNLRTPRQ